MINQQVNLKVALITGCARRIGLSVANFLHKQNWNIILHYHHSENEAQIAMEELNKLRANSVAIIKANLNSLTEIDYLAQKAYQQWGRIDALIHNASSFFPTPFGSITEADWNSLINSNFKAPLFLSQTLFSPLLESKGQIIHILDASVGLAKPYYAVYHAAKAALWDLTQTLAVELAPHIRVNGVAPGSILWPEGQHSPTPEQKQDILSRIPLKTQGNPLDIAETIYFLLNQNYITGQVIRVDGGKNLYTWDL